MSEKNLTIIDIEPGDKPLIDNLMKRSSDLFENRRRDPIIEYRRAKMDIKPRTAPSPNQAELTLAIPKFDTPDELITDLTIVQHAIRFKAEVSKPISLVTQSSFKLRKHVPIVEETNESFIVQPYHPIYTVTVTGSQRIPERLGDDRDDLRYAFEFDHGSFASRQYPINPDMTRSDWVEFDKQFEGLSMPERLYLFMGELCVSEQGRPLNTQN